jgi:signal transduction histidine kinase
MLTIRRKFAIVLGGIFILSTILFNLFLVKFFDENFQKYIVSDMNEIYKVSINNLNDYFLINNISKKLIKENDVNNKVLNFLVQRVNCQAVFYNVKGEILSSSVIGGKETDLNILRSLPKSFDNVKDNKTVVDIENKKDRVLVKLSYSIYGENNESVGVIVLIKDYSDEFNRNKDIRNIVNIIVFILFTIIFLVVYYLISRIIRPIIILKDRVSVISSGGYPHEIEIKSKDEIGVLIDSFNIMISKLKKKDEQEKNIFRNITHELKTPLTSISGYAQILREEDFDNEEFRIKALDRIIFESNRMHELVVTLLNVSKQSSDLEQYSFEEVNINEIINETLELQMPKIYEKELEIFKENNVNKINGNKEYITILINNLIDNAIKYSNIGTKVVINLRLEGEYVVFSIITEGKDIPKDMVQKIFEPFIRVEKQGFTFKTSHGLGLYICKSIVDGHGGDIDVIVDGNKSEFIVKLPNNLHLGNTS